MNESSSVAHTEIVLFGQWLGGDVAHQTNARYNETVHLNVSHNYDVRSAVADGGYAYHKALTETLYSPAQIGIISGVLCAAFLNAKFNYHKDDHALIKRMHLIINALNWQKLIASQFVYELICFCIAIGVLPLLIVFLGVLALRRYALTTLLKRKYGAHFCGLLEGTDAIWAIENDNSRSVINILAMIRVNSDSDDIERADIHDMRLARGSRKKSPAAAILLALRKRIASKLMRNYRPFPKMFYKCVKELGHFFWLSDNNVCIEEYIRFMSDSDVKLQSSPVSDTMNENELRSMLANICNQKLPCNHTCSWEILVGRRPLRPGCDVMQSMEEGVLDNSHRTLQFPILVRIHHALGDGVALLRLFFNTIADKSVTKKHLWIGTVRRFSDIECGPLNNSVESGYRQLMNNDDEYDDESPLIGRHRRRLARCNVHLNDTYCVSLNLTKFVNRLESMRKMVVLIFRTPGAMVHQAVLRKPDINQMHPAKLNGKKMISWVFESESTMNLFDNIRSIRKLTGARFSEIVLTALSGSLAVYSLDTFNCEPDELSLVLPARMAYDDPLKPLELRNLFSVGMQTLPVGSISASKAFTVRQRIAAVKWHADQLRNAPDYQVNFWIMSVVAGLLPASLLATIIESRHCTIALSNLPGPTKSYKIQGHQISNVTFWLPNRGNTGIGISIFSYEGKLQLGILADQMSIRSNEDCHKILDNLTSEIKRMSSAILTEAEEQEEH